MDPNEPAHRVQGLILERRKRGFQVPPSELTNPDLYNSQDLTNAQEIDNWITSYTEEIESEETPQGYEEPEMTTPAVGSFGRPMETPTARRFPQVPEEISRGGRSAASGARNLLADRLNSTKSAVQSAARQGLKRLSLLSPLNKIAIAIAIAKAILKLLAILIINTLITLLIGFGVLIIFTIFILFIINSGAYVVPPGGFGGLGEGAQTGLFNVRNVSDPSGEIPNGSVTVHYEVTISTTSVGEIITNIILNNTCRITPTSSCPTITNLQAHFNSQLPTNYATLADVQASLTNITSTDPFIIDYDKTYNLSDSTASDILSVTGTVNGNTATESGTATLCFGDCPMGCFEFVGAWPSGPRNITEQAIIKLASEHPAYTNKICEAGTITLGYDIEYNGTHLRYCGWHIHDAAGSTGVDIILANNFGCLENADYAEFLLAHETSHHLTWINYGLYQQFLDDPVVQSEPHLCTYPVQPPPDSEDFAEMDGLYANDNIGSVSSRYNCLTGGFRASYPLHWDFARRIIFEE